MRGWLGEHNRRRIGAATLAGHRGVLYDHPQSQGVFDDHLTFIWRKREITFAASLHTWTPRQETRRVLAATIAGLRPTSRG